MRVLTSLILLFILTACIAKTSDTREARTQSATPTNAPLQPIATLVPTAMPTRPLPPITTPAPESSVLLHLGSAIHVLDLATGKDAPGYELLPPSPSALSADGKKLAAIEPRGRSCEFVGGGTSCRSGAGVLHVVDLQARREVTNDLTVRRQVTDTLPSEGWVGNISLTPDLSRVTFAYNQRELSTILLADAHTAGIVVQRVIDFRPALLQYAQDGKTLVVYGQALGDDPGNLKPPPPSVALLDAATLEVEWEQMLTNIVSGSWCVENCQGSHEERLSAIWYPAVVPSHDGRHLYIVHADVDKLTTIDFSSRTIRTTELQTARLGFDNFLARFADVAEAKGGASGVHKYAVLSLDGTRLYVSGSTMTATRDSRNRPDSTYSVAALQVIDVASGRRIATRGMANRNDVSEYFHSINITPDGAYVFVARGDERNNWWTEVFDAKNLQPVARLDEWRMFIARRMDAQPILLAHQPNSRPLQLVVIDPHTFEVIRSWSVDSNAGWASP